MPESTALEITHLPVRDLRPDPANPRRISDEELESLTRSIREFGLIDPIIARREDKVVIGGHQRLIAARKLGLKQVPVVLVDISEEQAHVLNLALNRISGTWDQELLARLLGELKDLPDVDITLTGFSEDELQKHLKSLESRERRERLESFDLDAALEAAKAAPVAHTGDVWLLGDHRVLCGDSTDNGDVARLMNGEKASLMATDPPYFVDYSGGNHLAPKGSKAKKSGDNQWDEFVDPEVSVEFYRKFLAVSLEIWPESGLSQVSGSVFRAVEPAFRIAHGVVRRNLATDSMIKKATARTPMLVAASVLVVKPLQKARVPPRPAEMLDSPGVMESGRGSQRDCPSVPLVCAQHRSFASCANRSV